MYLVKLNKITQEDLIMEYGDVSCLGVLEEVDQNKVKFINRAFQQYAASKYIVQSIERARDIQVNYLGPHFSKYYSVFKFYHDL